MFERFSASAQRVIDEAREEAHRLGHRHVGTEHLLAGMLAEGESRAAKELVAAGATLAGARHKVAEVVASGRPDAAASDDPPFTPRAERAIERATRFALHRRDPHVEPEHVLLGVLDVEGTAGQVLRGLGVDVARLRAAVDPTAEQLTPPVAAEPGPRESDGPRCPGCGTSLGSTLAHRVLRAPSETGESREFVVSYCSACGRALGATPT